MTAAAIQLIHAGRQQSLTAKTPVHHQQLQTLSLEQIDKHLKKERHFDQKKTMKYFLSMFDKSDVMKNGGLSFTEVPPWSDIEMRYGSNPNILGLDSCDKYRKSVHSSERYIAPSGLFHSGTNLVSEVLTAGCHIMSADDGRTTTPSSSIHFQVPWGKHNPQSARNEYRIPKDAYQDIDIDNVLPIVMVRHPIDWMESMCRQPYAAKFIKNSNASTPDLPCPSMEVPVTVGFYRRFNYTNLLDLWKTWYQEHVIETDYPQLVVRLEDVVYRPRETLSQICDCGGGKFYWNAASTLLTSKFGGRVSKDNDSSMNRNGILEAWTRHARVGVDRTVERPSDRQRVRDEGNAGLLKTLGYKLI